MLVPITYLSHLALDSLERPENTLTCLHFNVYLPSKMADSNNCQGACVIIYFRCTISIYAPSLYIACIRIHYAQPEPEVVGPGMYCLKVNASDINQYTLSSLDTINYSPIKIIFSSFPNLQNIFQWKLWAIIKLLETTQEFAESLPHLMKGVEHCGFLQECLVPCTMLIHLSISYCPARVIQCNIWHVARGRLQ